MVAAQDELFPGKGSDRVEIRLRLLKMHRPADVPRDENKILLAYGFKPGGADARQVVVPQRAKHVHRLVHAAGKVQVG